MLILQYHSIVITCSASLASIIAVV